MNRKAVILPAYVSGGLCGLAAMFVEDGLYIAAGVAFSFAVVLLLVAEKAMDKWVRYWEGLLRVRHD